MQNLPENVREVISKLVPVSILDDIACFVLYDDHPAQRKNCDITICTKHGEVKEYFRREEVSSLLLRSNFKAAQIRIIRNSHCQKRTKTTGARFFCAKWFIIDKFIYTYINT